MRWEKHEPAPIEFLHQEIHNEFHKVRISKVGEKETKVELDGRDIAKIVAAAKKTTYEKYAKLNLKQPILKTDL